jgi:hypothetical protein
MGQDFLEVLWFSPVFPPVRHIHVPSWTFWPLKMGPIGCPETSVQNYHSTLHNIPEERRSHLHRGGSLKTRMFHSSVTVAREF